MANFLVSYDLRKQRNYQPLWDMLNSWGAVRLLESLWVVTLNSNTAQIRDTLRSVIDNDDGVAVIELPQGAQWSAFRAQPAGVNWLQQHVRAY